jgi:hypothetical protein
VVAEDIQAVAALAVLEQPQGIRYQLVHQSQSQLVVVALEAMPVLIMVIRVPILYLEALPLRVVDMAVVKQVQQMAPAMVDPVVAVRMEPLILHRLLQVPVILHLQHLVRVITGAVV